MMTEEEAATLLCVVSFQLCGVILMVEHRTRSQAQPQRQAQSQSGLVREPEPEAGPSSPSIPESDARLTELSTPPPGSNSYERTEQLLEREQAEYARQRSQLSSPAIIPVPRTPSASGSTVIPAQHPSAPSTPPQAPAAPQHKRPR
jgi:hypothetical protein